MLDNKVAIVIVSGSVGELDWNLEILNLLLNEGFKLKIVILKRKALKSIKQNKMVNDFINQKNDKIEIIFRGGYFIETIRQYIYRFYRILIKFKISKYPLMGNIFNLFNMIFQKVFSHCLPSSVLSNKSKKYLFLSEFPILRRPWDVWIRKKFHNSIFLFHPHSQHIYAKNFDNRFPEDRNINYNKNQFLLLGHQLDYLYINDGKEYASNDLEKVFLGHPSWSQKRIDKYKLKEKNLNFNSPTEEKINILILSKNFGAFFGKDYHNNLAETTINSIQKIIPNSNIFIKKHPREEESRWDILAKKNSSIKVINDHVQQIAAKVNFVISIWNSASVDCYAMGIPVIEYYDPNKFPKGMVFRENEHTSVYRILGLVIPANNEIELQKAINNLVNTKYTMSFNNTHAFFKELEILSNTWEKKIRNILVAHNLINNDIL